MTLQDIIKNLYAEIIRNQNLTKNHGYLNDLILKYGEIKNLLLLKAIVLSKISLNNESELLFKKILKNYDIDVDILYNYSIVLRASKKNNEYIDCINNILKIEQNHLGALNSLGLFYYENKNYQLALDTFNKILNISPNSLNALINISNLYIHQSEFKLAESVLKKVISLYPDSFLAYYSLGNLYMRSNNIDEAKKNFHKCISLNNNFKDGYVNLSAVYQENDEIDKAVSVLKNILKFDANNEEVHVKIYYLKSLICDWQSYDYDLNNLLNTASSNTPINPFRLLSSEDSPPNQQQRSRLWGEHLKKIDIQDINFFKKNKKVKIGYFSSDFHGHATMHLMSGLFRNHDIDLFEIIIYNYSKKHNKKWTSFINQYSKKVININENTNEIDLINQIRDENLDIAIDLKGYTSGSKIHLFTNKLAKLHISFLGYPGTLGAKFIDYIIADKIVIPEEYRKFYDEKIIFMPHCYQPNDEQRQIPNFNSSKQDHGLPEDKFIFCCFNDLYKISPIEFEIWMNILLKVEKSVLWLLVDNDKAKDNLIFEANKRGINKNRIIFAKRIKYELHLERHRHADLFLDCFNYNAHTTASDALWMNVPLITKIGKQFSARVAASLLTTLELTELITSSQKEYESTAIKLATNPNILNLIKEKLKLNSKKSSLYDSKSYTKKYEHLLAKALNDFYSKSSEDIKFK